MSDEELHENLRYLSKSPEEFVQMSYKKLSDIRQGLDRVIVQFMATDISPTTFLKRVAELSSDCSDLLDKMEGYLFTTWEIYV